MVFCEMRVIASAALVVPSSFSKQHSQTGRGEKRSRERPLTPALSSGPSARCRHHLRWLPTFRPHSILPLPSPSLFHILRPHPRHNLPSPARYTPRSKGAKKKMAPTPGLAPSTFFFFILSLSLSTSPPKPSRTSSPSLASLIPQHVTMSNTLAFAATLPPARGNADARETARHTHG